MAITNPNDIPKIDLKDSPMAIDAPSPEKDVEEIKPVEAPVEAEAVVPPVTTPEVEITPVEEPVIAETVVTEPEVVEPVEIPGVTPTPTKELEVKPVEPVELVKAIEVKKPEEVSVLDAQAIKSQELANKATEDNIKTEENKKTITKFEAALQTGNKEDITNITTANPELRDTFNSLVRNQFKTKSDRDYFGKYSSFTNEQLDSAVKSGDIVVGSEQYNSLPEEQRASFTQFLVQQNAIATAEDNKNQFAIDNSKTLSLENLLADLKTVFSSDLRTQYEETMKSSEIVSTAKDLEDKQNGINSLNDNIQAIEDDVKKQYPHLPRSTQAAIIADRQKSLLTKKNTLINEYNSKLGTYKTMKDEAQLELNFLKYEDQQNKAIYQTALGLYETRRKEMREDEKTSFIEQNKTLANERDLQNQKDLFNYKTKIQQENLKGQWIQRDDGLYFGKPDGIITKVVDGGKWSDNKDGTSTYRTIDENEQPVILNYDANGDLVTFSSTVGGDDFSKMTKKYPGQAWTKNNNPAGLTFTSSALERLQNAGINVSKGTDRPEAEGGAYLKFGSIQDGLMAYDNLWNQSWYQNKSLKSALSTWGTGSLAGYVDDKERYNNIINTNVSDLRQEDLNWIQRAQLQKESPGLVTEMSNRGWIQGGAWNIPTKSDYVETVTAKKSLSKEEFAQYDKIVNRFKSNAEVKAFESSLIESKNLIASLSRKNGVGDMAGIFQFMKTLDPTSVVRESEFESAAATAGVGTAWSVKAKGLVTGVKLDTKQQRIEFQKLAESFIKNRATTYDREYDDSLKIYERQGLDPELFPTRATDDVYSLLDTPTTPTGDNLINEYDTYKVSAPVGLFLDINNFR